MLPSALINEATSLTSTAVAWARFQNLNLSVRWWSRMRLMAIEVRNVLTEESPRKLARAL